MLANLDHSEISLAELFRDTILLGKGMDLLEFHRRLESQELVMLLAPHLRTRHAMVAQHLVEVEVGGLALS